MASDKTISNPQSSFHANELTNTYKPLPAAYSRETVTPFVGSSGAAMAQQGCNSSRS
jgi:hypothetical protein